LAKYNGKKEEKEYKRHFESHRKQELFSSSGELTRLYPYWREFSEEGPHANARTLGRRTAFSQSPTHLNWLVTYMETKPEILGPYLLTLLHVSHLMESVVFNIFEQRLQFDENLLKNRQLFSRYGEKVKYELQAKMEPDSAAI
jgi:hypothetical protein